MHFTDEFCSVYVSCWLYIFHPDISVYPQTTCCPYFSCENQMIGWKTDPAQWHSRYCVMSATPNRHLCAQLIKPVISQLCMQSLCVCVCVCVCVCARARARMRVCVCERYLEMIPWFTFVLSSYFLRKPSNNSHLIHQCFIFVLKHQLTYLLIFVLQ